MSIVTTPTSLGSGVRRVLAPGVEPQADKPTVLPVQITRDESPAHVRSDVPQIDSLHTDPNLAVAAPVLAPSAEEICARQRTDALLSHITHDVDTKAKALKDAAIEVFREKVEPSPEPPTFLRLQYEAERRALEADIARLQPKPESAE